MTLRDCQRCSGLIPTGRNVCPNCSAPVVSSLGGGPSKAMAVLLGAAASVTLMACYGAPPGPPPNEPPEENTEKADQAGEAEDKTEAEQPAEPGTEPGTQPGTQLEPPSEAEPPSGPGQ